MADLTTLDITKPLDGDLASQGASRIREERADIVGWAGLEHDLTGAHIRHIARTFRSSALISTAGVNTAIPWTGAPTNIGPLWAVGSPTRLTTIKAGDYIVGASIKWDTGSLGNFLCTICVNGDTANPYVQSGSNAPSNGTEELSTIINLAAADYIELYILSSPGATITALGTRIPNMWMKLLH